MESKLPNYIQKRINLNLKRIKELREILKDFDDDMESLSSATELYEEISFLIKENINLMSTNHLTQTYEEPQKVEEKVIDIKDVKVDIISTGKELEIKAQAEFGEQLYKVVNNNNTSHIVEDDMTLFKKYGIKFQNGLAVNVDIEKTPKFIMDKLRNINVYDRFKHQKHFNSEIFSIGEKYEKIYFESEIDDETFSDIFELDEYVEDRRLINEYKGKKIILMQMKPDYAVSNDYRYTIMSEPDEKEKKKEFFELLTFLPDKSKDFGLPTYKSK